MIKQRTSLEEFFKRRRRSKVPARMELIPTEVSWVHLDMMRTQSTGANQRITMFYAAVEGAEEVPKVAEEMAIQKINKIRQKFPRLGMRRKKTH